MFRSLKLVIISLFLIVLCNSVFSLEINEQLIINGLYTNINAFNLNNIEFTDNPATCVVTDINLISDIVTCKLDSVADYFILRSNNIYVKDEFGNIQNNIRLLISERSATILIPDNRNLSKEGLILNFKELDISNGKTFQFLRYYKNMFAGVVSSLPDNHSRILLKSNISKINISGNGSKLVINFMSNNDINFMRTLENHYYYTNNNNQLGYFFPSIETARENPLVIGSDSIDFSNTEIYISQNSKLHIFTNIKNYIVQNYSSLSGLNYNYVYPSLVSCPRKYFYFANSPTSEDSVSLPEHCENEAFDPIFGEEGIDCGGPCELCDDSSFSNLEENEYILYIYNAEGTSVSCSISNLWFPEIQYFVIEQILNDSIIFKSIINNGEIEINSKKSEINILSSIQTASTSFFFENFAGINYPKILNNKKGNIVYFTTCSESLNKPANADYNVYSFFNYSNNLDLNAVGISNLENNKIFNFYKNTCNAVNYSSNSYTSYLNMSNEKFANPVLFGNISKIFPLDNIIPNLSNPKLLVYDNNLKKFQFNVQLLLKINNSKFKIYNQTEINSNYIGDNSIYAIDSNLTYENDLIRLIYPYKLYK